MAKLLRGPWKFVELLSEEGTTLTTDLETAEFDEDDDLILSPATAAELLSNQTVLRFLNPAEEYQFIEIDVFCATGDTSVTVDVAFVNDFKYFDLLNGVFAKSTILPAVGTTKTFRFPFLGTVEGVVFFVSGAVANTVLIKSIRFYNKSRLLRATWPVANEPTTTIPGVVWNAAKKRWELTLSAPGIVSGNAVFSLDITQNQYGLIKISTPETGAYVIWNAKVNEQVHVAQGTVGQANCLEFLVDRDKQTVPVSIEYINASGFGSGDVLFYIELLIFQETVANVFGMESELPACCDPQIEGAVPTPAPPEGISCCEETLDPLLLSFPSDIILSYDLSQPGVAKDRILEVGTLGNGTTIKYSGGVAGNNGDGNGIYNPHDDKIYFLARKSTDSGVTYPNSFLIQFDPRTLTISHEMALPAGWDAGTTSQNPLPPGAGDDCAIVDIADERVCILNLGTGVTKFFSLVSFNEQFDSSLAGTYATDYFTGNATVLGRNNQVLLQDAVAGDFFLISQTSPTTVVQTALLITWASGNVPALASTVDIRRSHLPNKNLFIGTYDFSPGGGIFAVVIDLTNYQLRYVVDQAAIGYLISHPWWDCMTERILAENGPGGILEITKAGDIVGLHASDGNWNSGTHVPTGNRVFIWSSVFDGGGEFLIGSPSPDTPVALYEMTDAFVSPSGLIWNVARFNYVVAPRRHKYRENGL